MGQKINPIALRLKATNKNFASCWYSDTHYSTLLSQELRARAYLMGLLNQMHHPNPITSLSFTPKRVKALTLYLNPGEARHHRSERFQLALSKPPSPMTRRRAGFQSRDSDHRSLPSFNSLSLIPSGRQERDHLSSIDLGQGNGAGLFYNPMSHRLRGVVPTLPSILLGKGWDVSTVRQQGLEIKPLVCSTLVSLACQRLRGGRLLIQQDFELINQIRRFRWFQERWESCLFGIVDQGTATPPTKTGKPSPHNNGERPTKSRQALRRSKHPYTASMRGERGDEKGSIPSELAHGLTSSAPKAISSREPSSPLNREITRLQTSSRREAVDHGRDGSAKGPSWPTKASLFRLQTPTPQEETLSKALIGQVHCETMHDKELSRRGQQLRLSCIESALSMGLGSSTTIYLYRSVQEEQTAQFLSGEIAFYLERRVPFRRIKQALMRDLQKNYIEGVRVRCSGRVGGRSKKAQRAKEDGFQWGQTSSHVFSSKLSFDSRSALTPLGKIGIKVWICFK